MSTRRHRAEAAPRAAEQGFHSRQRYVRWVMENGSPAEIASLRRAEEQAEEVANGYRREFLDLGNGGRQRLRRSLYEEAWS